MRHPNSKAALTSLDGLASVHLVRGRSELAAFYFGLLKEWSEKRNETLSPLTAFKALLADIDRTKGKNWEEHFKEYSKRYPDGLKIEAGPEEQRGHLSIAELNRQVSDRVTRMPARKTLNRDEKLYETADLLDPRGAKFFDTDLFLAREYAQKMREIHENKNFEFAKIKAGSFMMGSPKTEEGRYSSETLHKVNITKEFEMGINTVTQDIWEAVMGNNPSTNRGKNLPVTDVSWIDVAGKGCFIEKLNRMSAKTGWAYRLPTEAEWEYAPRGGKQTVYSFGDDPKKLEKHAWFDDNSKGSIQPVRALLPNQYGLFDMYGNVWQWVDDRYGEFVDAEVTDPRGSDSGSIRVIRGGSWFNNARRLRSAYRYYGSPGASYGNVGFRLLRTRIP